MVLSGCGRAAAAAARRRAATHRPRGGRCTAKGLKKIHGAESSFSLNRQAVIVKTGAYGPRGESLPERVSLDPWALAGPTEVLIQYRVCRGGGCHWLAVRRTRPRRRPRRRVVHCT
jgi:hypothetical protein